jgi:hypothetical protein
LPSFIWSSFNFGFFKKKLLIYFHFHFVRTPLIFICCFNIFSWFFLVFSFIVVSFKGFHFLGCFGVFNLI